MQRTLLLGIHNMLEITKVLKGLILLGQQFSTGNYNLQTGDCALISGNTVPDLIQSNCEILSH